MSRKPKYNKPLIKGEQHFRELVNKYEIAKSRLELYETDYNENTDKFNRMIYEYEFKRLFIELQKEKYKKFYSIINFRL